MSRRKIEILETLNEKIDLAGARVRDFPEDVLEEASQDVKLDQCSQPIDELRRREKMHPAYWTTAVRSRCLKVIERDQRWHRRNARCRDKHTQGDRRQGRHLEFKDDARLDACVEENFVPRLGQWRIDPQEVRSNTGNTMLRTGAWLFGERHRLATDLRYREGLSLENIANHLNVNKSTISRDTTWRLRKACCYTLARIESMSDDEQMRDIKPIVEMVIYDGMTSTQIADQLDLENDDPVLIKIDQAKGFIAKRKLKRGNRKLGD